MQTEPASTQPAQLSPDGRGLTLSVHGFTITVTSQSPEASDMGSGLFALATELRQLAERALGVPPRPVVDNPRWPLSGAERAVVELVGEGMTNKQIGERLFVSHRTVESHVSHALGKLGLTSRVQLVRMIARAESAAGSAAAPSVQRPLLRTA